ncbi:MAG: nucleoside hydrolase [Aquabacterium sp.]
MPGMMSMARFPALPDALRQARLAPPARGAAVVIDTDCANEIDDQFALAWALLAGDRLDLRGVCAAPFSFEHRRRELVRARVARDRPHAASDDDRELLALHAARLARWEGEGWDVASVALHGLVPPDEGMRLSLLEIERVHRLLGLRPEGRVHAGSTRWFEAAAPEASAATACLIEQTIALPPGQPLYVLAMGCLSNIANALRMQPGLAERIVVVWTAGYPSHTPWRHRAFNLEQDVAAAQCVFDSGVPLVYLPGYHVGAQLRLSLAEVERHVRPCGAIGAYLHGLFAHNPLWPLAGPPARMDAHSWVIWDLIVVAWMLDPGWVSSALVPTPCIGGDLYFRPGSGRVPMREGTAVARDAIFNDLFDRLARAPG